MKMGVLGGNMKMRVKRGKSIRQGEEDKIRVLGRRGDEDESTRQGDEDEEMGT